MPSTPRLCPASPQQPPPRPRRRAWLVAVLLGLFVLPATAEAGRRPFIWVWDTEVVPEGTAEIEMWYWERIVDRPADATYIWTAPIFGLTDRLELALPFEWTYRQSSRSTQLDWYGAELRWRLSNPDHEVAGPLTALVRLAAQRLVRDRDDARGELDLALAYDGIERLHLALDLGLVGTLSGTLRSTYAAGASYALTPTLRAGAEVFGRAASYDDAEWQTGWAMVGPNVGWTVGRAWLTGGVLFGVTADAPVLMPRLLWAIAW